MIERYDGDDEEIGRCSRTDPQCIGRKHSAIGRAGRGAQLRRHESNEKTNLHEIL